MDATPTFTGRSRRRTTRPWVRTGDRVARVLITLGGIGTIVAVLLVGVFLLAVALPLFRPATSRIEPAATIGSDAPTPAWLGADETGAVAWLVEPDGGLRVVAAADGRTLAAVPAADAGLANATAVRIVPGSLHAAIGYADGSVRCGRLGLESSFVDEADLPAGTAVPERGRAVGTGDEVLVRGANGRLARVRPVAELAAATRSLDGPIIDVDLAPLAGGPLVAALDAAGRVRVESVTSKRNLLTDEVVTSAIGATIEPAQDFVPRFVRVSELGDQAFLVAADGRAQRHVIRDVEQPVAMEMFTVTPRGDRVTAVERLFGGTALAVADARGTIRVYFPTRGGAAAAADGLSTVAAREFPPAAAPVTALAASPRSRLFVAADAAGGVRLLQATSGVEVLRTELDGPPAPVERACIGPREDRLLVAGGGRLAALAFDAGHPDVTLGTLLRPVWYESYPGPVHAWETTGHEAFESKFGLVPLVFGTLKATLYAMLFATPVAILAAIYASQFMHSRWKARIKPVIELMAGLPSVVLGFVAGLVFAPLLERAVMPFITGLFVVPLTLVVAAHLWQCVPAGWRSRLAGARFAVVGLVALPLGVLAARGAAPWVERGLFQGDFRGWLDGRGGSGFGGWMLALLPLAAVAVTVGAGRSVGPWLRRAGRGWTDRRAALVSLGVFAGGVLAAVALAAAAAVFLDALRLDARGGLFGTYVQRNALVVGIGMSVAIIPLIFTLADDALSSVPDHLRSASLGAGATPWQTAVRVIVPAAASGLFSAVMIGLGRAVGETMIVLMAAGNTPIMDWNLFNGFETLSAAIATELPEAARGTAHYRVLFLAALVLFALTFVVNTAAEFVRQRFRRRAHEL
ncbi:MAG: ABC transporter permease subunit [Planctomycetaceae bacterium]